MKPKTIITEAILLLIIGAAVWIAYICLIHPKHISKPELDINLHDTYFVVAGFILLSVPFLAVTVFVYLIRESFYRYKRRLQNSILLPAVLLLNVQLLKFTAFANLISTSQSGWTIYPPLSALPKLQPDPPSLINAPQIFYCIQIFFLLLLVIVAIITGNNWKLKR